MLGDFSCRVALQLLGYVYPAYKTFKVVQLPATRSNDTLLRKWCCYWALIAVFTAVSPLADVFFFWLPLYYEAKLAFAVYLWANELNGAQYVWGRWFAPLVSRYEPVVDRRLAESKAVATDWLHSNTMRLAALAQAKVLAWLADMQLRAQQATAGMASAAPAAGARHAVREEEDEVEVVEAREARSRARRQASGKRASSRGGHEDAAGTDVPAGKSAEPAVPEGPSMAAVRSTSFSLSTFFSARSHDLHAADMRAGLKAFPLLAEDDGSPISPRSAKHA